MAKKAMPWLVSNLALLIILFSWSPMADCSKNPVVPARKEDIPYVKCQVCEKLASELHSQVHKKEAQRSPKKLVDQEDEGQCNTECKTLERACQEVVGYSDTDVTEYIYARKPQLDALVNYLCKDLTKACSKKPPPVPKDRVRGEPFVPKSAKEAEMEKMMRSMEGLPGAPGMKMYSREELMNMQNFGDEDADEDDDDDDEMKIRSNLGKALKDKGNKKVDWKENVMKQITNAGKTVKTHVNKVSYRLQRWWRSKKNAGSKKPPAKKKAEL